MALSSAAARSSFRWCAMPHATGIAMFMSMMFAVGPAGALSIASISAAGGISSSATVFSGSAKYVAKNPRLGRVGDGQGGGGVVGGYTVACGRARGAPGLEVGWCATGRQRAATPGQKVPAVTCGERLLDSFGSGVLTSGKRSAEHRRCIYPVTEAGGRRCSGTYATAKAGLETGSEV